MISTISWDQAVALSIKILSIGSAIQALEYLLTVGNPVFGGLNDWATIRAMRRVTITPPLRYITDRLFANHAFIVLNIVQLVAAAAALLTTNPSITKWLISIIAVCQVWLTLRKRIDHSAADQMQVIIYAGCAIYYFADDFAIKQGAIWLVGMEVVLFYIAAGTFKATAVKWRDYSALKNLLRTKSYSTEIAYKYAQKHPWIVPAGVWSIFIFECGMPLFVFAGPLPCLVFIACGIAFHTANAFVMGLNDFFWAFSASYPLLYCISIDCQQKLSVFFNN
jgi:hypothetical protein